MEENKDSWSDTECQKPAGKRYHPWCRNLVFSIPSSAMLWRIPDGSQINYHPYSGWVLTPKCLLLGERGGKNQSPSVLHRPSLFPALTTNLPCHLVVARPNVRGAAHPSADSMESGIGSCFDYLQYEAVWSNYDRMWRNLYMISTFCCRQKIERWSIEMNSTCGGDIGDKGGVLGEKGGC